MADSLPRPGDSIAALTEELGRASGASRLPVLERLGDAHAAEGKAVKALACYEQAWAAGQRGPSFLRKFASELGNVGEIDRAMEVLEAAPDLRRDPREHGLHLLARGQILHRKGGYAEAERFALQAVEWLRQHRGAPREIAECVYLLGSSRIRAGRYAEARRPLEEAREVYRDLGDVSFRLRTENYLGLIERTVGNYDAALAWYAGITGLPDSPELDIPIGNAYLNRATIEQDRGSYADARRSLQEASVRLHRTGNPTWTAALTYNIALVAAEAEDWPTVRIQGGKVLEQYREAGNRSYESATLELLARADLAAGKLTEARERARQSLELVQADTAKDIAAITLRTIGQIELALGEPAAGLKHLEESVALLRLANFAMDEAISRVAYARALLAAGRAADARRQLEPARSFFTRIGAVAWLRTIDSLGQPN